MSSHHQIPNIFTYFRLFSTRGSILRLHLAHEKGFLKTKHAALSINFHPVRCVSRCCQLKVPGSKHTMADAGDQKPRMRKVQTENSRYAAIMKERGGVQI